MWCCGFCSCAEHSHRAQWDPKAADIRELILSSAIASVVTTAILALALAWVLFRFLFRTATSYDIAALPVRRESLFCTNLLCGLAIALGTHLLIALITYGASALIGFPNLSACMELVAAAMLSFLGFFGFAVLLCIIVGNAVAMPLIYIVLNFTAYVVVQDRHGAAQQLCLRPRQRVRHRALPLPDSLADSARLQRKYPAHLGLECGLHG